MFKQNDHVLEYVDDYLHDVLEPADAGYVAQHCASCRICKTALEEAQKRLAALETVASCEASGTLIQATLKRIAMHQQKREQWRRRFSRLVVPLSAAAAVLIALGQFYYSNLKPTPYELAILGQAELLAGTKGSVRIQLVNHETGAGLADVPVDIELRNNQTHETVYLANFKTNGQGSGEPRFDLPDWPSEKCELRVVAHTRGGDEVIKESVKLTRSWKLLLTSDKPVYQPGQTIHLRSLGLRRPDLHPVATQDVTFQVADPKGNIVFKKHDLTSKFGIASIDCPLADEIIEGPYTITCKLGDTESKRTVDVKKYVLPKFKIGVELSQPFFEPGAKVSGKVQAAYFFGKPVAGANVDIEVVTTDVAPRVIKTLNFQTDASGNGSFVFLLPDRLVGREQQSGDARVTLQVLVTDSSGQKEAKATTCTVTNRPLRIEVIPEAGQLVRNVPNRIYVYTSYADGRPAKARVAVSGLEKELATNDLGVTSFELPAEQTGTQWTFRATDGQGRVARETVSLAYGAGNSDFLVRTDKAVYNGGDTAHIVALGSGKEPVFVDIIKDGQTVLTETMELTNGRGTCQVDLPADLFGTVELCAYRLGAASLAVRKTRVVYIRPAGQLNIKTTLDHDEYRPGGKARLNIALSDDKGQSIPGAVSLMAVDEAVYSVLDQAPGMERTFYLLEQQLLKPVYAIYNWSPFGDADLPPAAIDEFEQALFSRTSRQGTDNGPAVKPREGEEVRRPTPYSLFDSSLPQKLNFVAAAKAMGLHWIGISWLILGGWFLLVGVVALIVINPTVAVRGIQVLVVLGVLGFMGFMAIVSIGHKATSTFSEVGAPMNGAAKTLESPMAVARMQAKRDAAPPPLAAMDRAIAAKSADAAPAVRVREWFPETLLWRPEVITDDKGLAKVDVELADSITTWRLMVSAVAADGRLGAKQSPLRVFQPFFVDLNLPIALTRGDEVGIPVVVYNYLDKPQTVELALEKGNWFERQDDAVKRIELPAGAVRSTTYRLRVNKVGQHELQVTARAAGIADAIKKSIEVVPDGRRVEHVVNGTLQRPVEVDLTVPEQSIEGSPRAILKFYPSSFSQLVEGLDAIFRMPSGCFEQTSSTTYPNVLALDYLKRTKKSVPEVEAKARQYIHLGYQRLLGFEVSGGGFDWFGHPPANRVLTAYGLMEFQDMAKVHDVDPNLIARTRQWLLKQRNADGSWSAEGHWMHEDPTSKVTGLEQLSTTAYIAWAVFGAEDARADAGPTADFIRRFLPSSISDAYVLALVANTLFAIDPEDRAVAGYLERLESIKQMSPDGKQVWWDRAGQAYTTFRGGGLTSGIETTALAALAFMKAGEHSGTVHGALNWIVAQKDAHGTWRSTQSTVLALKALVAASSQALGESRERRIDVRLDNGASREVVIPPDQADVVQQIDLSEQLSPGPHRLTLSEHGDAATIYQVAFRYHVPGPAKSDQTEPLAIELAYDRENLAVDDTVTATASVRNQMSQTAPMVLLDLPIPAGFAPLADDWEALTSAGTIAKFQLQPRSVLVYLRAVEPGKPLKLHYRLRATMPVKLTVPPARAYEYYNPDKQGTSKSLRLTVNPRAS
jgi:hypothetical protein